MATRVDVWRPDRALPGWIVTAWERLGPRVPRAIVRGLVRGVLRLPRGSRARRWSVLTATQLAWKVTGRGDPHFVLPFWDPQCEWHWDPTFRSLGFDEVYRGHEGVARSLRNWSEVWTELSFAVREVLDGGNTWVIRMTAAGRGVRSGAATRQDFSAVVRLAPAIVEFRNFADDEAALRESGLSEPGQAG